MRRAPRPLLSVWLLWLLALALPLQATALLLAHRHGGAPMQAANAADDGARAFEAALAQFERQTASAPHAHDHDHGALGWHTHADDGLQQVEGGNSARDGGASSFWPLSAAVVAWAPAPPRQPPPQGGAWTPLQRHLAPPERPPRAG